MSSPKWKIEELFAAVEELRALDGDGLRARKLIDALFRRVHNLKATASANGLNDLAAAAHEFENVLHYLRRHSLQQSIVEGARVFLVQASFDVADFDQQFQRLKESLNETGEVISTSPAVDTEKPEKVNFKIVYARKGEPDLSHISEVTVEEISPGSAAIPVNTTIELELVDRAFEKFAAELGKLPALSFVDVFEQAVQSGRSAAIATGKEVDFEIRNHDLKLDETSSDAIGVPLIHLVRNAVDHGIEASENRVKLGKNPRGKIVIEAATVDGEISITVRDDGRGIDPALIHSIFDPGFSTAAELSQISGRGVGLDVVKTSIEEAGGSVTVSSQPGHGSTFLITFPS